MPESFQALMQDFTMVEQRLIAVLAVITGLLILFYTVRPPLRHWWQERQIASAVNRLGALARHNVHLPDGIGGEIMIDHLLLATDALLVVGVKRYDGLIFGGRHTDIWTQTINNRSYKFPNPDHLLQLQISAVRNIVPDVAVKGLHLFTHHAVFPRDKPSSVLLLEDVRKQPRKPKLKNIHKELRLAWNELTDTLS